MSRHSNPADDEAVLAWHEANGATFRQTAAHFGMPLSTAQAAMRRARMRREVAVARQETPTDAADLVHPADMDLVEYLRAQLGEVHHDMRAMRECGSWVALTAARKDARRLRYELEECRRRMDVDGFDPRDVGCVVNEVLHLGPEVLSHPLLFDAVVAARGQGAVENK